MTREAGCLGTTLLFFCCGRNRSQGGLSWHQALPPWRGAVRIKWNYSSHSAMCLLFWIFLAPIVCWNFSAGLLDSHTVLPPMGGVKIYVLWGWQQRTRIPPSCWCHSLAKVSENFSYVVCRLRHPLPECKHFSITVTITVASMCVALAPVSRVP